MSDFDDVVSGDKPVYIYVLRDPRTNEVRYVGKTEMSLKQRLAGHLCEKNPNEKKRKWLHEELIPQGLEPIIEPIETCNNYNWDEREIYWIAYYEGLECDLVNACTGGLRGRRVILESTRKKLSEASRGKTPTDETRRKLSEASRGRTVSDETRRKLSEAHRGKKHTDETRRKLSEASRGKTPTDETRRKLSEASRGRRHTDETRRKLSEAHRGKKCGGETCKKLSKMMRDRWQNDEYRRQMSEARRGRTITDEHSRKMSEAWRGKKHTGETLRKMSEVQRNRSDEHRRKLSQARQKRVIQYSPNGQFIRYWDSATEAQKSGLFNQSNISTCCRRKREFANGYIWRYADDPLTADEIKIGVHQLALFDDDVD